MKRILFVLLLIVFAFGLVGCDTDANVASRNLSTQADMFQIMRRIVFYNGITGDYILEIQGLCSLGNSDTSLRMSVTCKVGPEDYKKHYLGLSDNVTFFAEQLDAAEASAYHYKVIFKPELILPDIDLEFSP
jgi:hypothetical protein